MNAESRDDREAKGVLNGTANPNCLREGAGRRAQTQHL